MSYDDVAAIYDDAYAGEEFRREDRLVSKALRNYVPAGSHVLDVGCGTGKGIELLSNSVSYVGLDLSEKMLDVARATFPSKRFVQGDVRHMPFEDESFDVVVSTFGALSHVLEIELALAEIHRVLRPKGRAFLMVYGLDRQTHSKRRGGEVLAYKPRGAALPDDFTVSARIYSAREVRELILGKFTRVRVKGLTVLGSSVSSAGSWRFAGDIADRMLCSLSKDRAHTLCIRASKS